MDETINLEFARILLYFPRGNGKNPFNEPDATLTSKLKEITVNFVFVFVFLSISTTYGEELP
jgi:hypothetical protein